MNFHKFALFALSVFLLGEPCAHAESKAQWKGILLGRSTDDSFSSSRTVGLVGLVKAEHDFNEYLSARFQGGAFLETGSSSALFTNEFEPRSRLILLEAFLLWKLDPISAQIGALNQNHHSSPLLIESGTFPAGLLAIDPKTENWVIHADAQAAIPTSQSLSTRATGKENTPLLFTQKIVLGWAAKDSFSATARASHFQFKDLTRGIAQDSRFYGNTVTGIGAASRFLYEFSGFEAGPDFKIPLGSKWQWNLGGSAVQNSKGPKNANQGLFAYTEFVYKTDKLSIAPKFEWYRQEADAVPGFYSSAKFGHNNRKGTGGTIRLGLPGSGIDFELKVYRSDLIEPRTFQKNRFEYLELSVEMPYVDF